MKPVIGRRFLTRDGHMAFVATKERNYYIGIVEGMKTCILWSENGFAGHLEENDKDLVAPYKPTNKDSNTQGALEYVVDEWFSRSGQEVRIASSGCGIKHHPNYIRTYKVKVVEVLATKENR